MTKRISSILLSLYILFCCCLLPIAAQNEIGVIRMKLNSDIAGQTYQNVDKLIELQTNNVVFSEREGGPVYISDYAGTADSGSLVAGRTYYVYYLLTAGDGYTLPDRLTDGDVEITCGKGVSVIATQIVKATMKTENGIAETFRGLQVYARVVVDGNIFQRVIGYLHDMILKIRAWSLY